MGAPREGTHLQGSWPKRACCMLGMLAPSPSGRAGCSSTCTLASTPVQNVWPSEIVPVLEAGWGDKDGLGLVATGPLESGSPKESSLGSWGLGS